MLFTAILLQKKEPSVGGALFGQFQGQEPLVMDTTLVVMLLKPGPVGKKTPEKLHRAP